MRLLDLFCGAGGAGMGYHRAGFDVVGVDIAPQKHYPFEFHQADALEYLAEHGREFDAIHASPPCQAYSTLRAVCGDKKYPELIGPTRDALIASGSQYVIENVCGAPLRFPIMLCGTMFGLETPSGNQLIRHRLFETSFSCGLVPLCRHNNLSAIGVHGGGQHPRRKRSRLRTRDQATPLNANFGVNARRLVMGIDWMTGHELNQAIPPAYTEYIGRQLMAHLLRRTDQAATKGAGV